MLEQQIIERAMLRGLTLAARGPIVDENPRVGCVIVGPDGETVAEGWHLGAGTPHAEVSALARIPTSWRARAAELTAVVTLEPCNHTGRTGPCALALHQAGIGHVAYAIADPGRVEGGGAARLRAAGVEVTGGVLETEAREFLAGWLAESAPLHRPRVIAKWAQSLDGRAAAADGSSQWITGSEARADVHLRRAAADAILVGTGTVLADNPSLTARIPRADDQPGGSLMPGPQPIPVVFGRRVIPADARINSHPAGPPILRTGDDLAADLTALAVRGVRSVFVEGGPTLTSALIAADLVDELLIYLAPVLIGGPRTALGDIGVPDISAARRLVVDETVPLGADLLVRAHFDRKEPDVHRTH